MRFPENKKILLVPVPPTYVEKKLCAISMIPPGIFRIISFLKKRKNTVRLINTMGGDETAKGYTELKSPWKKKELGVDGKIKKKLFIAGTHPDDIETLIIDRKFIPDEIWISCSFTCDYEIANAYSEKLKKIYPSSKIIIGGDAVKGKYQELKDLITADEIYTEKIYEANTMPLDTQSFRDLNYGIFQLQTGCPNRCSFCNINEKPLKLNTDITIANIKMIYDIIKPKNFWNFDPNPLLFRENLIEFLNKYREIKINSILNFVKGFQINKINKYVAEEIIKTKIGMITFPIESTTLTSASRFKKPYTVISTVKALELLKQYRFNFSHSPSTFLVGYPDDDLNAIFRAFLISLKYNSVVAPFPVFLFPGTADFKTYQPLIKNKDLSLLHGQLWPLLPSEKIPDYDAMLGFMMEKENDISKLHTKIPMLPKYMQNILINEMEKIDRFIENCLNAKKDSIETLKKIEDDLYSKKRKRKKYSVYIINSTLSSPSTSLTLKLKEYLISELKKISDIEISEKYLSKNNLPVMDKDYVSFIRGIKKTPSHKTKKIIKYINSEITKIEKSDIIILTVPMYAFTIPSQLLAYLQLLSSYHFFKEKKDLTPKQVIAILSRGGKYPPDGIPYQKGYPYINCQQIILDAIIPMLNLSKEVKYIVCEGQFDENKNAEFEKALNDIKKLVNEF